MGKKDRSRKWLWALIAGIAVIQLYAVQELLVVYAFFILGFGVLAVFVLALYTVYKTWEVGVAKMLASRHPFFMAARRSVAMVEELGRRPFRRPGSEPVS
jgi:hypothetical protein